MKIGNTSPYDKFITSTVNLDADEAVASRKIDLEFKSVLPNQNKPPEKPEPPEVKETEIYLHFNAANLNSPLNPIGKAFYTVSKQSEEKLELQRANAVLNMQKNLQKKYHTVKEFPTGILINSVG